MRMVLTIHIMNNQDSTPSDDMKERNPADYPLLGVLMLGPAHGYDLCAELRDALVRSGYSAPVTFTPS